MKKFIALLLCLAMVFALAACGTETGNDEPKGEESGAPVAGGNLTFGTGGETGTYYAFGGVLAQYVSGNTDTTVTAVSSKGSQANIEDLDAGDIQLGFVQSDVMSYAYNGERLFENPITDFSVVAALYMEQVQIVTLNPDIKTVADLKGKTVSVGAAGSGVYYNAVDVLGAYDIDIETDITAVKQDFSDSTESLQDGKIDAAFIVAGAPTNAISSLAATKDVYLVSLDQEHIDILRETNPYYSPNTIAADVYGTPEDVTTVAVNAVVIARDDCSETDIYNFVSSIFENIDSLSHAKAEELDLDFAASVTDVPYHPGAAKYFAEKGIEVPVKTAE